MTDKIDELASAFQDGFTNGNAAWDGTPEHHRDAFREGVKCLLARLSSIDGKEPVAWRYRPDNKAVWQYSEGSQPNSISGWLFEPLYASPAPPVEGTPGIIPDLDELSGDEKKALLAKAEWLWKALQENNIGGYSDGNRPFYILSAFKEVIEDFGRRNVGWRHSKNEIDAHRSALTAIGARDAD